MVPWTRAINKQKLDWVIATLFDLDATDALPLALAGAQLTSLTNVLAMPEQDIELLIYQPQPADPGDPMPPTEPVPVWQMDMVKWLIHWYHSLMDANNGVRLTPEDWDALTQDQYDTYRTQTSSPVHVQTVLGTGPNPVTP